MGIFHCLSSNCARIRYQPYKKASNIRYRYPGEDWTTIDGDNYELNSEVAQCTDPDIYYAVLFDVFQIDADGKVRQTGIKQINGRAGYRVRSSSNLVYFTLPFPNGAERYSRANVDFIETEGNIYTGYTVPDESNVGFDKESYEFYKIQKYKKKFWWVDRYYPVELGDDSCDFGDCNFKVYKDGQVIFEETRPECPEVEQEENSCQLSDRTEVIKVKKSAYLQQVEVTNQGIETYGSDGSLFDTYPLPEECLNIYKTFVDVSSTSNNSDLAAETSSSYEFVAQICSRPGCPPPEYEVICNCSQECPSGTCAVFCGNHVCCHDPSTGTAIEQIPIDEYVRGN